MKQTFIGKKRIRKYFGKIREVLEMPNLIEVQKSSYELFLKSGDQLEPLDGEGIKGVFQSVFPKEYPSPMQTNPGARLKQAVNTRET